MKISRAFSWKSLLVATVVSLAPLCFGQQDGWNNLAQFRRGEHIEVMDSRMRVLAGEFVSYSPEALTLHTDSAEREIARTEVARVTAFKRAHRGRNTLIGLGAGAGIGAGLGAAIPPSA